MDKDRAHKANKYFNALLGTEDVKLALYMEGVYHRTKVSGHMLPQQGREYVELRDITFSCDRDYIIDVPEYDDLSDGTWYEKNYEPKVFWQIEKAIEKLANDSDTRQAVIQFYDADDELKAKGDMICTMFSTIRVDNIRTNNVNNINKDGSVLMTYSVYMRSNDVREFRSDLKWHKKLFSNIIKAYVSKTGKEVIAAPIIWTSASMQCWDKDWEYLA